MLTIFSTVFFAFLSPLSSPSDCTDSFFPSGFVTTTYFVRNKAYAEQIDLKVYLLTKRQIPPLFSYPECDPIQLRNCDLNDEEVYLVVRIKNHGKSPARGDLSCLLSGDDLPIILPVIDLELEMKGFFTYVIPVPGYYDSPDVYPDISLQWKELFTLEDEEDDIP